VNNEALSGREIIVESFGEVEVLQLKERTFSAPPPGHARVRVLAVGVGFTDLMARRGDYLLQRKLPFTPGYELVGEVVDHEELGPGTLVAAALPKMGAYADYVVLPSWLLVPLPDGLDPAIAATVPLDYLTALSILETHAQVTSGDTVLIHGASGGVGQALSRLGRRIGLRMYGTASAAGSEERLARHGVSFIDYRHQDFASVIAEREPEGISAVFDHIGGANIRKGYRLLAHGGVFVSYAFAGRPGHMVADTVRGALRVNLLNLLPGRRTAVCMLPKEIKSNRDWYRHSLRRLLEQVHAGELEVTPGATFPLTKAADVHRALERHEINGKVVLTTK
jgi:NADPH2:quinone reductase